MSKNRSCPNPACKQAIPPGSGAAKCPACGAVLQPRAQPQPPLALPVEPADTFDFGTASRPRKAAAPRRPASWLVFGVLALLVACGAYAARSGLFGHVAGELKESLARPETAQGASVYLPEINCRLDFPDTAWEKDDALKAATRANALAASRKAPDVAAALFARDYKTTNPDAGILVDEAARRLGAYFATVEYEQKGDLELSGQKAQRLVFQGKVGDAMMSGECYLLAHQGVAYWLAVWTSAEAARQEPDAVRQEFERFRKGFVLGHERDAWQEKVAGTTFTGTKAAYAFQDVPGLWQKWPDPAGEDEAADLLLLGNDSEAAGDIKRKASVLVLLLERKDDLKDAAAAARAHVEAQHKRTFGAVAVETVAEQDGPLGGVPAQVTKLHVRDGETRERFVLLVTLLPPGAEQSLAIQCECDWRRRPRWEALFQQLLGRLRVTAR